MNAQNFEEAGDSQHLPQKSKADQSLQDGGDYSWVCQSVLESVEISEPKLDSNGAVDRQQLAFEIHRRKKHTETGVVETHNVGCR